MTLTVEQIDPPTLPPATPSYTHGTIVTGAQRLVFVSGQPPWAVDQSLPTDFAAQCRLAWGNVERVLAAAGMTLRNLVKVTVYLSDRRYRETHSRVRGEVLGDHRPAITVIITDIYSSEWLLEIEGIAVA
jgi:enamine deaminase RidA (YjgF/YER057c/UK114 family)